MAASSNNSAVYMDRELLGNMTNPTFADVAEQCRLPLLQLSHEEADAFPDLAGDLDRQQTFVQFRNKILQVWLQLPEEELSLEKCRQVALVGLRKPGDAELLTRIYHWLIRGGFINYGVFTPIGKRRGAANASNESNDLVKRDSSSKKRSVIVIGAGIAGLTAARQLAYFGFDVTVLEARERLGGRICTVTRDYSVDLGAMVITGLIGNPLAVLLKQLKPKMVKINHRCPLYDSDGDLIPSEIDEPIEREFNRVLRAAAFLANDEQLEQELMGDSRTRAVEQPEDADADADGVTESNGQVAGRNTRVSLGEVVDGVIALQRRTCLRRSVALLQALVELKMRAKPAFERLRELCERVKRTYAEVERERQRGTPPAKAMRLSAAAAAASADASASNSGSPSFNFVNVTPEMEAEAEREINRRLLEARLRREIQEYEETEREYSQVEQRIADVQAQLAQLKPMQDIYANSYALRTLYWHVANLEFANATALDKLSLRFWDQDDHYRFDGAHVILSDGYKVVAQALARDLNIKYLQAVKSIEHNDDNGVTVTTVNSKQKTSETTVYKADCVLCTLPLGVLKGSVAQARASAAESESAADASQPPAADAAASNSADQKNADPKAAAAAAAMQNAPRFIPSLPRWKTAAIRRLGYGTLNKVALRFSHFFWDRSLHLFGYVNETLEARGEYYLFWSYITAAPVLIAFVAGRAAEMFETAPNEAILKRVVSVLQRIFAKKNRDVPWPKQAIISRWRSDVWSLGSYSYVAANCTGDEYDLLSLPVSSDDAVNSLHPMPCPSPPPVSSADTQSEHFPRLFFAGEHTVRNFPATVNGAFLSGMREARRIADLFTGRPYAGPPVAATEPSAAGTNAEVTECKPEVEAATATDGANPQQSASDGTTEQAASTSDVASHV